MTTIRRYFQHGQVAFLTHVTLDRTPHLQINTDLWQRAFLSNQSLLDYEIIAWVVMPEHFHIVIDPKDWQLSGLMRKLKLLYSGAYRSRYSLKRGRLWQYSFWDRVLRDQDDLNQHIDYIHYNPVGHGIVTDPKAYSGSSFNDYLRAGVYSYDWGCNEGINFEGDFGE